MQIRADMLVVGTILAAVAGGQVLLYQRVNEVHATTLLAMDAAQRASIGAQDARATAFKAADAAASLEHQCGRWPGSVSRAAPAERARPEVSAADNPFKGLRDLFSDILPPRAGSGAREGEIRILGPSASQDVPAPRSEPPPAY